MATAPTLSIASGLSLPIDAVTQKLAFLGRTGSGKTYGAGKLVEEMLYAKAQAVILDAVGVWYGLRLSSSGKEPGISIPVFGGLHGDIPLEPGSGQYVADLIVDHGLSVILDVSQFEHDTEKARFATDWANRFFFRKKAAPSAVHVVIEECQEFVPQNPQKGEERMLHAFQRIEKLGRNFGIGVSLISQRPQEVSKKALNQTECMFAFQMTGPQERKAIENWIADKGLDEDIANILPKLDVGQAHVWSPQWLKISKTFRIGKKSTFNASGTPEVGKSAVTRNLASIDLDRVRKEMAATIERARAEDPKELKKKIAELQRQIAKPNPSLVQRDSVPDLRHIERAVSAALKPIREQLRQIKMHAGRAARSLPIVQSALEDIEKSLTEVPVPVEPPSTPLRASMPIAPIREGQTVTSTNGDLSGPERKILRALGELLSIGKDQPPKNMVAAWSGYSPLGGAFGNPMGALRSKGLIDYPQPGAVVLTEAGRAIVGRCDAPDSEEIWRRIESTCTGPEQKILRALIDHAGQEEIAKEQLAEKAGYSPVGGAFGNPIGALRTKGLLDYPRQGVVKAADWLFAA